MYAVEFESSIKNGVIHVPSEYKHLQDNVNIKCFIVVDEQNKKQLTEKKMNAISIDTRSYKFDRDEAHER